jgi:hypothetical protein
MAVMDGDFEDMMSARLRLALSPVLPARTAPRGSTRIAGGYVLRLVDGPALDDGDPLLGVFGACAAWLTCDDDDDRVLQGVAFDPGRRLRLLPEPLREEPGETVAVWDAEGVTRAGTLEGAAGERASAAVDHGLAVEAVALWEERSVIDDRRERLKLVVFATPFVEVEEAPPPLLPRSAPAVRQRVVLFADEGGDLRWWDPAAAAGPVDAEALPVSAELAAELSRLQKSYRRLRGNAESAEDDVFGLDELERSWQRDALQEHAHALWLRARSELGRRFVVGYLGPGMERPLWSPGPGPDDDIPF